MLKDSLAEIPTHWQFRGRNQPERLTIRSCDPEHHFLSYRYTTPASLSSTRQPDIEDWEAVFDQTGVPTDYYFKSGRLREINLIQPGRVCRFSLLDKDPSPIGEIPTVAVYFFDWLEDELPGKGEWIPTTHIKYWRAQLGQIHLPRQFAISGKSLIEVQSNFWLGRKTQPFLSDQFEFYPDALISPFDLQQLSSAHYLTENGQIVVTQEHIASGAIKRITTPLRLDPATINATFNPFLPSATVNQSGEVYLPWRHILAQINANAEIIPPSP